VDLRERRRGTEDTQRRRAGLLPDFAAWVELKGYGTLPVLAAQPREVAEALAEFGQELFETGGTQGNFSETINAVQKEFHWLRSPGVLRFAWDINAAWENEEPGQSRAPVPPVLIRAIGAVFLLWRMPRVAALMLLGWEGALRPADMAHLTRADLRLPTETGEVGATVAALFLILRHAKTRRTSARVQNVRIVTPGLLAAARDIFGACRHDEHLFDTHVVDRVGKLSDLFGKALRALRVPCSEKEGYTLAGLRPGGLTALFRRCGNMPLVVWRGRWDESKNAAHYLQELEGSEAYMRLPDCVRTDLYRLSDRLPELLAQAGVRLP
jgi:hypothetical protein